MDDASNKLKTKMCPKCQKQIPEKATRCAYCQADLRSWPARHKALTALIVLLVLGLGASSSDKSPQTASTNPSQTSETSDEHATFASSTVAQLVQNAEQGGSASIVSIKSVVVGKYTTSVKDGKMLFFAIKDDSSASAVALVDISDFPQLYSQFKVGDRITVNGIAGSTQCDNHTSDELPGLVLFCKTTTQIQIPMIITHAPNDKFNKRPIERE